MIFFSALKTLSLITFGLSFSASASDKLKCPSESVKMDYVSPSSGLREVSCVKIVDGRQVKHGATLIYDKSGDLKSTSFYANGIKKDTLSAFTDKKVKRGTESASSLIKSLIAWSGAGAGEKKVGDFTTRGCEGKPADWLLLFTIGQKFSATYKFGKACDISGSWTPRLDTPFPANFKLKNLDRYKEVTMTLVVTVNKPKISYKVTQGVLTSGTDKIKFSADYHVTMDLASSFAQRRIATKNHVGFITFHEINGKRVNLREPIHGKN